MNGGGYEPGYGGMGNGGYGGQSYGGMGGGGGGGYEPGYGGMRRPSSASRSSARGTASPPPRRRPQ